SPTRSWRPCPSFDGHSPGPFHHLFGEGTTVLGGRGDGATCPSLPRNQPRMVGSGSGESSRCPSNSPSSSNGPSTPLGKYPRGASTLGQAPPMCSSGHPTTRHSAN